MHAVDANSFISVGGDGMAVLWRCAEKDGTLVAQIPAAIFCLEIHHDMLFLGTRLGEIYSLDFKHKLLKNQSKADNSALFALHHDGNSLWAGGQMGRLMELDPVSLELKSFVQVSDKSIRRLYAQGEHLIVCCSDGSVYVYDKASRKIIAQQRCSDNSVFAWQSRNGAAFTAGRDARIHQWEEQTEVQDVNAHWYTINDLSLNPELPLLASASMDKSVKIWQELDLKLLKVIDKERLEAHSSSVNRLLWLDAERLVTCSDDRSVQLFRIEMN